MGEYEFVVSDGSGRTQTRAFPSARFTIGAGADCQMRFDGAGLLATHAEVLHDQRGQPWVRDLTGRGLLQVNGESTKQAMIPSGTLLRLGGLELVVRQRTGARPMDARMASTGQRAPAAEEVHDATLRRPTPFVSLSPAPQPPPAAEPAEPVEGSPDDSTLRSTMLKAGTVVGERYLIEGKLAAGGMGEVYRAQHVELGKPLALKVMLPELSRDPEFVARFKREAIAATRIGQQNIVDIFDFGSTKDGRFYFVMEFLDGLTLASVIHRGGAMLVERAVRVTVQVARALAAAHALGIVHRDLKPENVMLLQRPGQDDFVKVLDFGVAKVSAGHGQGGHTAVGMVVGTPQYMSPEQAKAIPVDARSDIYSLGLIVYELLSGRPTFYGETPSILMVKHVTEAPPPLVPGPLEEVPGELEDLIFQMLEKDPNARPQTMQEVVKRLDALDAKLRAGAPLRPRSGVMATPAVSGVAVRVSGDYRSVVSSGTRNSAVAAPSRTSTPRPRSSGMAVAREQEQEQESEQEVVEVPKRSALPLVLILVGLLAVVGVAGAFLFRSSRPEPVVVPTALGVAAEPAKGTEVKPVPPTPEPAKPPPTPRITFHLRAVPARVEVYEGGAWIGKTPLDVTKDQDSEVELRFSLDGYKPAVKTVRFVTDQVLTVELEREPRHRPAPGPARPDLKGFPDSDPGNDLKPLPE